jgi:hypothetical protein
MEEAMDAAIGTMTTPPAALRSGPADVTQRVQPAPRAPRSEERPFSSGDGRNRTEQIAATERRIERDDATGSLIFRLIDVDTGDVAAQTPSEARLRLRAYVDSVMASQASEPSVERMA